MVYTEKTLVQKMDAERQSLETNIVDTEAAEDTVKLVRPMFPFEGKLRSYIMYKLAPQLL